MVLGLALAAFTGRERERVQGRGREELARGLIHVRRGRGERPRAALAAMAQSEEQGKETTAMVSQVTPCTFVFLLFRSFSLFLFCFYLFTAVKDLIEVSNKFQIL